MLSPEYYEGCADDIIRLYQQLEDDIISDVIRRIMKSGKVTATARHLIEQLQESGILYDDILKTIASQTDATTQHVKALFEDAGVETVRFDNRIYRENGLTPVDIRQSPAMRQTLEAGYRKTLGNMKNLTLTTANTSQTAYINACNQAYMQITSGAFSYQEAIRQAIQKTAQVGVKVLYPSGHTDRIDVAVRRAVLTGVGQTCREIGLMNAEECGCDLMEISAHSGARPAHAQWQGKIVSLSGKKGYLSKSDIGYGTGDGFGGWNCRHDWYPFFEGYSKPNYSKRQLEQLDEKNIEYNGRMYSQYEISQIQRRYEREIRSAKREQVAFKVAVEEANNPELLQVMQDSLNYANSLVKDKQAKMRDFIRQTGQNRDYFREQNYPKSDNFKKAVDNLESYGIINNNNSFIPAVDVTKAEEYARNVLGIKNVSYKGVDIVTANEWNRGLAEAFSKFPELKKNFGFVGTCQERNRLLEFEVRKYYENRFSVLKGKVPDDDIKDWVENLTNDYMKQFIILPSSYAESFSKVIEPDFPDFYGISVSDNWGRNSEKFISYLKRNVKNKFHPEYCDTIKSAVDHEIGHQLDSLLGISQMYSVRQIFDILTANEIKTLLSGYSVENENPNKYAEPIAEAWAEYCNNPNPRPIAKFIGEIIVETYNQKFGKV
ncbi:MAG: phage minor capsid protein [Ruminococcus sp.]|nr:phage minor capsid protein [Ruminococcus sp.]